jgi:hypothetical protein
LASHAKSRKLLVQWREEEGERETLESLSLSLSPTWLRKCAFYESHGKLHEFGAEKPIS